MCTETESPSTIKNYRPHYLPIYYLSKLNGLVPFTISKSKLNVNKSEWSTIYSFLFTIIFLAVLLWTSIEDIKISLQTQSARNVQKVIRTIEKSFTIIRTTLLYGLQIIYRKQIICVINDAIQLWYYISKGWPTKQFFDRFFIKYYKSRIIWLIIQIIILIIAHKFYVDEHDIIYDLNYSNKFLWHSIIYMYSHIVSPIITGIFYYGGMLIVLQFYRILNEQILLWMSSIKNVDNRKATSHMRMQFFCEISDNIDEASIFYSDITEYTAKVNRLFQLQIILTVMSSFFLITSNVRFSFLFYFWILFYNTKIIITQKKISFFKCTQVYQIWYIEMLQ